MARLFVGTFLGQEEKERIALASQENIDGPVKLRWAKVEKLHVTWLFLGDVAEDLIPSVTDALSRSLVEFKQQADEQRHLQLIFDSPRFGPMNAIHAMSSFSAPANHQNQFCCWQRSFIAIFCLSAAKRMRIKNAFILT